MVRLHATDTDKIKKRLLERSEGDFSRQEDTVKRIIADVRQRGDDALFEYIAKFENFTPTEENITVSKVEIEDAYDCTDKKLIDVLRHSARNIRAYHEKQIRTGYEIKDEHTYLAQRILPVASAGVYVPGGKASYPSSVLMNIIPAKVAGVPFVAMATPAPDGNIAPLTLVAAAEAGADIVYKMGGAHAVAALAYGTKSVKPVDKITGPGNIYVALAKKQVFGKVGIDMIAGPSEVLVIADDGANPGFIAADFLSQAEHDELAACVLVTDSEHMADVVEAEIIRQAKLLPKRDIIEKSLENYGTIIVARSPEECAYVSNMIAPEHLEICTREPEKLLEHILHAGSIFLGDYTPEPLGDYMAGTNHVLPTNGTARFSSPLGVDDFIKKTSVIKYTKEGLRRIGDSVQAFAEAEGLHAHARCCPIRFEEES